MNKIKYCKFCDKEKPEEDFCKSGGYIKNICRDCQNKKQKQIYQDSKKTKQLEQEIEKLNNIINELKNENKKLYNLCETNNISYLQGLEDSEKINDFKYSDFVKKWLKDTKEKLQRGDIYERSNNNRKE